jgi:hypothetical protein
MLTANLTVVDNHAALTLPGALGSKVYNQIASAVQTEVWRRIAATANTTPQTILIGHKVTGVGFFQRIRSTVRTNYSDLTQDTTLTNGVIPSASVYTVIDRPTQSAGKITDAIVTNLVGAVCDVLLTSGNLAQILNQEQ